MKLNKPPVTESQSELESYVASLLTDEPELTTKTVSKVTILRNNHVKELDKKTKKIGELPKVKSEATIKGVSSKALPSEPSIVTTPNKAHEGDKLKTYNRNVETVEKYEQTAEIIEVNKPAVVSQEMVKPVISGASSSVEESHQAQVTKEYKEYSDSEFRVEPAEDPRLKNVEQLLARIALASAAPPVNKTPTDSHSEPVKVAPPLVNESQTVSSELAEASFSHRESQPLKDILGGVFQTLVFEVSRLPLAVPLVKLGGIVNLKQQEITPLVGTPDWFMGLVPNERGNLMVVDTQKFLMPEKNSEEASDYQYLIVLDDSRWALACDSVGDAKNLTPEDIRWSARSSKRPWFAGMVVEYMSALVEVDELINLLADNIVE